MYRLLDLQARSGDRVLDRRVRSLPVVALVSRRGQRRDREDVILPLALISRLPRHKDRIVGNDPHLLFEPRLLHSLHHPVVGVAHDGYEHIDEHNVGDACHEDEYEPDGPIFRLRSLLVILGVEVPQRHQVDVHDGVDKRQVNVVLVQLFPLLSLLVQNHVCVGE